MAPSQAQDGVLHVQDDDQDEGSDEAVEATGRERTVDPELRRQYQVAYEAAYASLQARLDRAVGSNQTWFVLDGAENEFEVWEAGEVDDPTPPPIPDAESLRKNCRYVFVDKATWAQVPSYEEQLSRVFGEHNGAPAELSYKLIAIFATGMACVRASLRTESRDHAFCELVQLTKAMVEHEGWYIHSDGGVTDPPDFAAAIVKRLGGLWSMMFSLLPEGTGDVAMLASWLEDARNDWEGDGSARLGVKMSFPFVCKAPITPPKRTGKGARSDTAGAGSSSDASPNGAGEEKQVATRKRKEQPLSSRKRKAPPEDLNTAAPPPKQVGRPVQAAVNNWVHRHDRDLQQRQACVMQVRCEAEDSKAKRTIVFSGAYPLRAVGIAVAEAFGRGVAPFTPSATKGKAPPGMTLSIMLDGEEQQLRCIVKIIQAMQDVGDEMRFRIDGLVVLMALESVKFKSEDGFEALRDRPMPRCVGGDTSFTGAMLRALNKSFLNDRRPLPGRPGSSLTEVNVDNMAKPITCGKP
eukprot:TRINITY_DN7718_c0_g1_i2.p1 TRINITY_DN7718_c0_g1~~TRINITY_DN7718_c0_g1_i2.p1  ORF type:complete len:546 (+),score=110.14 TRINITY_DN7718_c0_g1_i2:75-1640(+)